MMPCTYTRLNGLQDIFDLDDVIDVVRGDSPSIRGWSALIVYLPLSRQFIELRETPQDLHGNSIDEAEEVNRDYVACGFGLDNQMIENLVTSPTDWIFIDRIHSDVTSD